MTSTSTIAEDLAIAHFVRLGVTFTVKGNRVVQLWAADKRFSDSDLAPIAALRNLVEVSFFDCRVSNGVWKYLSGHRALRKLMFFGAQIADSGLANLQHHPHLPEFGSAGTNRLTAAWCTLGRCRTWNRFAC